MKKLLHIILCCSCCFLLISCQKESPPEREEIIPVLKELTPTPIIPKTNTTSINILALGDSYTIGESVCKTCRFPEQLKSRIINDTGKFDIGLEIIAQTGWTTSALKDAISNSKLSTNQDLVTLLIGVNNQYQRVPFNTFEKEFPELVSSAIKFANNKKENVIIISIPDYAYTPFGNGNASISKELDTYNNFIDTYCQTYGISYIYITDITRKGLEQPSLVASDGLHPSELAYFKFVNKIAPIAIEKLNQ